MNDKRIDSQSESKLHGGIGPVLFAFKLQVFLHTIIVFSNILN